MKCRKYNSTKLLSSSSAQAEEDDNNSIYTQTLFFHHGVYQIIRVHGSRLNPAVRKDNGRRAIDAKFASQFYIVIHSRRSAFGRRQIFIFGRNPQEAPAIFRRR